MKEKRFYQNAGPIPMVLGIEHKLEPGVKQGIELFNKGLGYDIQN